jgi:hypothetical protein
MQRPHILGWKFVEEAKMSNSPSGKAQTTAMAAAMEGIGNAAWRRVLTAS